MNQKTIIYIILLALLLHLYYKRRDVTIIIAFMVLLGSTFIFGGIREGAKSGTGSGKKVWEKRCSELGFTTPKITKSDLKGSLEKTLKNIESVAKTHWPFDDLAANKPKNDKSKVTYEGVIKSKYFEGENEKVSNDKEKQEKSFAFILGCAGLYTAFVGENASKEEQTKIMKQLKPDEISKAISGGETYLELLRNNHKTLEGSDVKKLSSYLVCLCRQWLQILKQYKEASSGGDNE